MGLLDDAIREHLELKRRSGEDSRRLAQLEHEAFGPIRRGDPALDLQPPAAGGDAAAAPEVDEPSAGDLLLQEPAPAPPHAYEPEPATFQPEPEQPEPVVPAREPAPDLPPEPVAREPEPYVPPAPAPEPDVPPATQPAEEIASLPADQPTAAFSLSDLEALGDEPPTTVREPEAATPPSPPPAALPAQDVVPADDEGEHDVLEETPEFLEETPEHDRLWFEQKPPRDFEF